MTQSRRPALAAPRAPTLEAGWNQSTGGWDVDAYHAQNDRDEALLADEIINGVTSEKFLYQFQIQGTDVVGISVIGARHLAYHYGGLKYRIVSEVQKNGELFTFTTYPHDSVPMNVSAQVIRELGDQPDYYEVLVEVTDVKNGNSVQVPKREYRFERRRDGSEYERPHYRSIAISKARRNAILESVPVDVQIRWRNRMVSEKKVIDITGSIIEEKRGNVIRFAAKQGLLIDRRAIEDLTLDQIAGLGDAARSENQLAFVNAARALQLEVNLGGDEGEEQPNQHQQALASQPQQSEPQPAEQKRRGRPPKQQPPQEGQQSDPPTSAPAETAPTETVSSGVASVGGEQQQEQPASQQSVAPTQQKPAKPASGLLEFC